MADWLGVVARERRCVRRISTGQKQYSLVHSSHEEHNAEAFHGSSHSILSSLTKESLAMNELKDTTIALNIRLKPSEPSAHPRAANYTNVGVAKGIAYLDFGFIEPSLLAAIAKAAKDGQAAPKGLDGHMVTRVAMDVSAFVRLQQQIQQVLVGLRTVQQPMAKE